MNVTKLDDRDLAWADWVFISGMVLQRASARKIIARCREKNLKVIAGGPLFTSEYDQFKDVDHFVLNEAELTLPHFLADLEEGRAQRVYKTSEFCDIHGTPAPLWELINFKHYATLAVQFSRGCPFNCDFCNITALLGHRSRMKTADQIIAELDGLYNLGWRGPGFFVDDNFIGNKQRNQNRNMVESVKLMQRAGLQVQGGFIVGFDSDTPSIFQRQIEFIQKSGIVTAMVGLLNAPPPAQVFINE